MIHKFLLFREGDPFVASRLAESERKLRARASLHDPDLRGVAAKTERVCEVHLVAPDQRAGAF